MHLFIKINFNLLFSLLIDISSGNLLKYSRHDDFVMMGCDDPCTGVELHICGAFCALFCATCN